MVPVLATLVAMIKLRRELSLLSKCLVGRFMCLYDQKENHFSVHKRLIITAPAEMLLQITKLNDSSGHVIYAPKYPISSVKFMTLLES